MHLNLFAIAVISFIPLLIGAYWYHPKSFISKYSGLTFKPLSEISPMQIIVLYLLSKMLVFGFANLVIHQLGFYELFMTDIIKGSTEYDDLISDFMGKYGHKHRHFGHGVFHGGITAFLFALPFIVFSSVVEQKSKKYVIHHFSYWLVMSLLVGGCIAQFV